jgi:hypothetical protein
MWHLNDGKLHHENAPAVEWVNGDEEWWLHGELHREHAPAIEWANGHKEWFLHGKRHRDDGAAIERANGTKSWFLHGIKYQDANAWAKNVLKMRNELCDDAAAENYLRTILTKDDLI